MIHAGVELVAGPGCAVPGGLVHGGEVLVAEGAVGAARDVAGLEVGHQVSLALHQPLLISRQTAVSSFRYIFVGHGI